MCSFCARRLYHTLPPESVMFFYTEAKEEMIVRASHAV